MTSTPPAPAFPDPRTVEAVVRWMHEQELEHEASFQVAREKGDDAAMDRCAARARSYGRAADCIRRGDPFEETSDV